MLEPYVPDDWRGPMLQQVLKDYVTWEGPHAGTREEWEEGGAAKELSWIDLPSGNRGGLRGMRTQAAEPRKKGEVLGVDVFHFVFVSHNSTLLLYSIV